MKKRMFFLKVYLVLFFFAPLALIPSSGHSALLSSRRTKINPDTGKKMEAFLNSSISSSFPTSNNRLSFLSPEEVRLISAGRCPVFVGGEEDTSPLSTNETAGIILTLVILGIMVGFVSQDH